MISTTSGRGFRCILNTTTHRGTYNRANKNLHAYCEHCRWHGSFWKRCYDQPLDEMTYTDDLDGTPYKLRFRYHYNWKLVSKNKKQWMRKHMKTKYSRDPRGRVEITFGF